MAKHLMSKGVTNVEEGMKTLTGPLIEKMLEAEMDNTLDHGYYEHGDEIKSNYRNGKTHKRVHSSGGDMDIRIPRDRKGIFDPIIIPKYSKNISSIDKKIIAMYVRGLSQSDISEMLFDIYGAKISEMTISNIIQKINPEIENWQNRQLDKCYAMIFFDAIHLKIMKDGIIKNIAVYIALGYKLNGYKDILGLYTVGDSESAKDRLKVFNDLKNRGVEKICIGIMYNLKGISQALNAVFEGTKIQKCLIHQIRNSLKNSTSKDKKELVKDMRKIYKSSTKEEGEKQLIEFTKKRENKYPTITKSWWHNWDELSTFYMFGKEIRKMIYTTNAIEGLNR